MRVLLVDADVRSAEALGSALTKHGHEVARVESGADALRALDGADLVLLDLDLPDMDGIGACRAIRAESDLPLITFACGGSELDRVLSLQAGADDCLVKPLGFRELIARIDAVMRRVGTSAAAAQRAVSVGELHIDPGRRQVHLDERLVPLTRKEFDLLSLLASVPGRVFSRQELMADVWADDWAVSRRTVDTHISTLRNKLGTGEWIVTVRGVGYRLESG